MNKRQIEYLVGQFNEDEALLYLREQCRMSDEDAERTVRRMQGWLRLAIDEPPQRDSVTLGPLEREVVRQELQRMVDAGDGSSQMLAAAQRVLDQIGKRPAHLARLPISDSDRRILDEGHPSELGLPRESRPPIEEPKPAQVERRGDPHEWVVVGVARGDGPMVKPIHDMRIRKAGGQWILEVDGDNTAPLWGSLRAARIEASRRDAPERIDMPPTATVHSNPDQWQIRLRAYIRGAFAAKLDGYHVHSVDFDSMAEEWRVVVVDSEGGGSSTWVMQITSDDDAFVFRRPAVGRRHAQSITFPIPEEL